MTMLAHSMMKSKTPREQIALLFGTGRHFVQWPQIGDAKGPREDGWPDKRITLAELVEGYRVGVLTATEVAPGKFLHDSDTDWAPGASIAEKLLLPSGCVFGRASKPFSHCLSLLPEALPTFKYEDPIDKTTLLELRGAKVDGGIGHQTMVPPSVWSKNGKCEPLEFRRCEELTFHADVTRFKHRHALAAIGMLLAKHLGHNGFGHEARLCVAGFLLRAGVDQSDVILMGEAMSGYCNNSEVGDVRRVVESTVSALTGTNKKVKGGPSLAKLLGTHGKQVIASINKWLGRDFHLSADGKILAKNQHNIRRSIELLGHELSYDEFSCKQLINDHDLNDSRWRALYLEIEREHGFLPPLDYYKLVVEDVAEDNSFHPVKRYLDSLNWDGNPRLDTWLIRCAGVEDTPYVRAISSIMLIAAVRRIRQPGVKYDEMVIFESGQGLNKSSALRALCPSDAWFSDDFRLNLHAQQLIEATLGKWIIEVSELSGKRKTELEQLKAMLSRQSDGPARMAYAHVPTSRPRHFILIGTTNSKTYLPDSTGARRFWPVEVQKFNVDLIRKHRDQMWAEACVREARGDSIRLPEELWPAATEQQNKRREVDPWEDALRRALLNVKPSSTGMCKVSTSVLWDALGVEVQRQDQAGAKRISAIMQRLGFTNTTVRIDGKSCAGYVGKPPHVEPTLPMDESEGEE